MTPLLPLATAAREQGHEVVLAAAPEHAPLLRRRGFTTWAVGPTFADMRNFRRARENFDALPPAHQMATDIHAVFGTASAGRVTELGPLMRQWNPQLVVHDPTEFAAPVIARTVDAARVVHGIGVTPVAPQRRLLEHAARATIARWGGPSDTDLFETLYLDPCPPSLRIPNADTAFARSLSIRPAVQCDTGGDFVYLTLGNNAAPRLLSEALRGLQHLDIVVGADPKALGSQPSNVHVAEHFPGLAGCRAVIHHGGAATTFSAFAHGVPQLVLPQAADNFVNAAAALRTGAALTLSPASVSAAAVADAVHRLLVDPRFRRSAETPRDEIAALPTAAERLGDAVSDLLATAPAHVT
ncbi:glycosyltransferase [Nocardia lasii]|uniref:Glycosyltransferase n=1 Tax=Nocardia lasii TaxID=1616107 RepID=A0ABW1JQ28_9NOCA